MSSLRPIYQFSYARATADAMKRRIRVLQVWMTPQEHRQVRHAAMEEHLSLAEFTRWALRERLARVGSLAPVDDRPRQQDEAPGGRCRNAEGSSNGLP